MHHSILVEKYTRVNSHGQRFIRMIPEMFVTNVLNFATEGKCFRYGAVNAPVTLWGPWYSNIPHKEGDLTKVQRAVSSITRKEVILDLFRYFTLFSTDKHNRKIKIVCRYQQYEGANLIKSCAAISSMKALISLWIV